MPKVTQITGIELRSPWKREGWNYVRYSKFMRGNEVVHVKHTYFCVAYWLIKFYHGKVN